MSDPASLSDVIFGKEYYDSTGVKRTGSYVAPSGLMADSSNLYSGGNRATYTEAEVKTMAATVNTGTCSAGGYTTSDSCENAGNDWTPTYQSNYRTILDANNDDESAAVAFASALKKVSDGTATAIPGGDCGEESAMNLLARPEIRNP